ncbi:hypothetical protein C6P44_001204 [Monosporozyma unispora]|nr:hypothetical protein C6P44_001204 [Kazachstania unispora]
MSTWLFLWAVGGANKNMVIFAVRPGIVGFWILGFLIVNLSSTYYPFVLNNNFYRYGYIFPVHNLIAIYRVIFFNTSRWKMGTNYGILIAWIVINIAAMPFFLTL